MTCAAAIDILASSTIWRNARSLNTISKIGLFRLVVESLHSVFDFVERLLLSVKSLNTDKIEAIVDKVGLDGKIQRRITSKRRAKIDLEEPWLQIRINQNIETKNFEAIGSVRPVFLHLILNIVFSTKNGFNDDIEGSAPE